MRNPLPAIVVTSLVATLAVAGTADAAARSSRIATGAYHANASVAASPDVEFTVHKGGKVSDLVLTCEPTDDSLTQDSGFTYVEVKAPKLTITKSGALTYSGPSVARTDPGGATAVASTLTLNLHHTDGPTKRFTYMGRRLTTKVAWKGTVSSPVCSSLPRGGRVTLVGKVTETS